MLSIWVRRPSSPAPKANEGLVKVKFYAEIAKSAKRPGFGRQGGCDWLRPAWA